LATKTLTYIYSDSTAILGPLATFAEPHAYDLCDQHSQRMSAPVGWTVMKQDSESQNIGPSSDDLMAIADAVREIGNRDLPSENLSAFPISNSVGNAIVEQEIGRRGHLRAVPNSRDS
jgi:hypothetical protein